MSTGTIQARRRLQTLFVATALAGPAAGETVAPPAVPQVRCEATTPPGSTSLCVKAVALQLGPTDQVEAYDPIRGMWLSLNVPDADEDNTDSAKKAKPAPGPGAEPKTETAPETSLATDREGRLYKSVAPGIYKVCATGESIQAPPRRVSFCQEVEFKDGTPRRLLISHTPFGDFLSFSWQP